MKLPLWIRKQYKRKPRIYIMPTKMGGYLNGLVFLMFLLSIGYSNNLLLIFTLFLFGLNLIWLIQTHFHLHHLKLDVVNIQEGHAGDPLMTRISWKSSPPAPVKWELRLESYLDSFPLSSIENTTIHSLAQFTLPARGIWQFDHIRIQTQMPFGLYQSWIYLPLGLKVYSYPAKLKNQEEIRALHADKEGEFSSLKSGPHDVWNLGPYQGEESRKISWKHYAKSGELVVKEGEELTNSVVKFVVPTHLPNKEFFLSKMATQMVQCLRTETAFSLETPTLKTATALSEKHLQDCLRELTQC